MKNDSTKIIIAAAAGAAAGVVAGLLMAPSTGKDSRDSLVKALNTVAEGFNGQLATYMEKFNGLTDLLKSSAASQGTDANGTEQA